MKPLHWRTKEQDSYLNMQAIMAAAETYQCRWHSSGLWFPGGERRVRRVVRQIRNQIYWPYPHTNALLGDKISAKETMLKRVCPAFRGARGLIDTVEDALKIAKQIGYP